MKNKKLNSKVKKDLLIKPTTEERMEFIAQYVPKWMKQFGGDSWEVAHRLKEEVEENFQFKEPTKIGIHDGHLLKDVSLCHIMVEQSRVIDWLCGQLNSLRKAKRASSQ